MDKDCQRIDQRAFAGNEPDEMSQVEAVAYLLNNLVKYEFNVFVVSSPFSFLLFCVPIDTF